LVTTTRSRSREKEGGERRVKSEGLTKEDETDHAKDDRKRHNVVQEDGIHCVVCLPFQLPAAAATSRMGNGTKIRTTKQINEMIIFSFSLTHHTTKHNKTPQNIIS